MTEPTAVETTPPALELVQCAEDVARGAGALLRDRWGRERTVTHKGTIDIVTDADHAAEAFIVDALRTRYPTHTVVAEESGLHDASGSVRWIVDPIDGTVNFAHGLPHFAVLIAAQIRTGEGAYQTVAGVTYQPMTDELFAARLRGGATLNGRPIRVSAVARPIDSLTSTGFSYRRRDRRDDNYAEFCRMSLLTQGERRLGSAGLDLAYVAAGRLDIYWEYDLKIWDFAPGILLVSEAGGSVTRFDGEPVREGDTDIVASNGLLHPTAIEILREARTRPIGSREGLPPLG